MKFITETAIKLFFLFSTVPFLLSEKINEKFHIRITHTVVDSLYTGPHRMGELDRRDINESSGLAVSRLHPNLLYTHNDSGAGPEVLMIDTTGHYKGKITLEGAKNRDWEDLAIGPGKDPGTSYIYVGDIGDNDAKRDKLRVYRFPEPTVLRDEINVRAEQVTLVYPDGPRDAETLLVDPWSGDLLIVTKRDTSNVLYRATVAQMEEGNVVLERVMKLPITLSVGGDISADGKQIVIKNYWAIYYWQREEGESLGEVFAQRPVQLPYKPEPQGEAIGFSPSGDRFYTLSENRFRIRPVLYQYLKL